MTPSQDLALLLDCVRPAPDATIATAIQNRLLMPVEWHRIFQVAIPHGLFPLVAHRIDRFAGSLVSDELSEQMHAHLHRVRQRNHTQAGALLEATQTLQQQGIRLLAFKGPALAVSSYGDLALRESHDLDLWTDRADLPAAGKILRSIGYQAVTYARGLPFLGADLGEVQTQFMHPGTSVLVELQDTGLATHFHFSPNFEELWERRRLIRLLHGTIPTLGDEDLLLVLAAHGSKHIWRRFGWVVDIARVVESAQSLNWKAVLDRAAEWQCRKRLLSALALAAPLCNGSIPQAVLLEINQYAYASHFEAAYYQHLFPKDLRVRERSRTSKLVHAAAKSINEIRHHCSCTDQAVNRLDVAVSECRRRARWLVSGLRTSLTG